MQELDRCVRELTECATSQAGDDERRDDVELAGADGGVLVRLGRLPAAGSGREYAALFTAVGACVPLPGGGIAKSAAPLAAVGGWPVAGCDWADAMEEPCPPLAV
jgi:hypothetical protein